MKPNHLEVFALWRCGDRLVVVPISEEAMEEPPCIDFARRSARVAFKREGCSEIAIDEALTCPPRFFVREWQDDETYTEVPYQDYVFLHGTLAERSG
jgi:hypothetical protein